MKKKKIPEEAGEIVGAGVDKTLVKRGTPIKKTPVGTEGEG